MIDTKELRRLCDAATPGCTPEELDAWEREIWDTLEQPFMTRMLILVNDYRCQSAAREAVPELLQELADTNEALAACQSEAAGRIAKLEAENQALTLGMKALREEFGVE